MTTPTSGVSVEGWSTDDVRRREDAGRAACRELTTIDGLVDNLRLASFRAFLCATVRTMSAIVPDVLEVGGCDQTSALQRIRPAHSWPQSTQPSGTGGPALFIRTNPKARSNASAPRYGAAVIADGPKEWIEAAIIGCSFDVLYRSFGLEFSTRDGLGRLRLGTLPEAILAACPGRTLDAVVDHPMLRGRGFLITRTWQHPSGSMLEFDVGRAPLLLPWRP